MAISKDNTRTMLTLPKTLKKQLEENAKAEKRSLNNYILWLIEIGLKN